MGRYAQAQRRGSAKGPVEVLPFPQGVIIAGEFFWSVLDVIPDRAVIQQSLDRAVWVNFDELDWAESSLILPLQDGRWYRVRGVTDQGVPQTQWSAGALND